MLLVLEIMLKVVILSLSMWIDVGTVFFTKNGELIPQFPTYRCYDSFFASLMLSHRGDEVEFNFGARPFKFDVHGFPY